MACTPTLVYSVDAQSFYDNMTVTAVSDSAHQLIQPCVDCGLWTGNWCECLGSQRMPNSFWEPGQHTPLCSQCEATHGGCHYCRKIQMCTPFAHGHRADDGVFDEQ